VLPPPPGADPDHFDIFQNYEIEADDRDALQKQLRSAGVGTLVQWGGKAVHQLSELGITARLPYTERMIARSLMLPMNVSLSNEDVEYVSRHIRAFYGRKAVLAA
jgi:dTDP-4-amino-4,6-dideoxygalactose transaminase